jgi:dTDP-4-dehydrorhamnose reductase
MRIAVTGTSGQVATSLARRCPPGVELIRLGRPALDLERPETVAPALGSVRPDIVVSAAAWTAVDAAEDEPARAHAVNALGAGAVAEAAAALGVRVIHLSTDYVFDGTLGRPYRETDEPGPLGVYGATKLEGERAAAAANPRHLILRTAWVYSPFGRNFVRTMLDLAGRRDEIAVVDDQFGNPTSALDIADAIFATVARATDDPATVPFGLYHLASAGEASWADLAEAVMAASAARGGPSAAIRRIPSSQYPTRAPRPADTRLDCSLASESLGIFLPHWRDVLPATVAAILEAEGNG